MIEVGIVMGPVRRQDQILSRLPDCEAKLIEYMDLNDFNQT